ncbi:MAG TPA: response regulator, partial [Planctomycetaceae bacterium]|nr:response regulator [Planctomycetaceae bacterium]
REVGTEGKLGGQADVRGVAGTWKDLTDRGNSMAGNLTAQVRNIAEVTTAVANGDLSKKITVDVRGEILELKDPINTMVDQLRAFASEVTRVAREVGTEGKLGGQAYVPGVGGTWKDLTDNVNSMARNLTGQVRNIADVTKSVAYGDLSKKITVDVEGEILELKNTVNTMVDQLSSFASEVTRVAREVGTEGKLGGQAHVKGVSGVWKDLTDSVNSMAGNLTSQVRGIAKVVTSVANGDLRKKLTVDAKGEIAELADTINNMIDTLAIFADQVTTVAREVGVEGKLGGQASVPGAAGTWKDLTDNVNQLAANLTTQVRAIAEVATAVAKGDLTRSITVGALGEVAVLQDNVNEMIRNLKETTQKNAEQDWLKTNLAKFSRMLQGQKDLLTVGRLILSELAPVVMAHHAVFYTLDTSGDEPSLVLLAGYAYEQPNAVGQRLALGQGLIGQCAAEKQKILLTNVPPDYIHISSGLGSAKPRSIIVLPVIFEGQVKAVLELASFDFFSPTHEAFLDQLTESIGIVLNTIEANMRTEDLLSQSQSLANELQSRQQELQTTNVELQENARLLALQNAEVERKNVEVEQARQALEEKASQLALTSKYKSEFMANMSHELRTPLNSLLILSDQLSKNNDGNLSVRQMEYAKTIHSSGTDLLMLINDILDLTKIESGTVVVDVSELRFRDLEGYVERTFRHVAESKGVDFTIALDPGLPEAVLTDSKRLQQVIKNLLSNAFKFTHRGHVSLCVAPASGGWDAENEALNSAESVIAISVTDTGIGISPEKQRIVFEAFQQADGSTNRKYGGTGLGLAISREIARLLGGQITLVSAPGEGSTFTLYVPQTYTPVKTPRRVTVEAADHDQPPRPAPLPLELELEPLSLPNEAGDDRNNLQPGDRVLLIVDNEVSFARLVLEAARAKGFKGLVTPLGSAALVLARDYQPDAITLDIRLPDIDGWRVLSYLKSELTTRHIPVFVISTVDNPEQGLGRGAIGVLAKPIESQDLLDRSLESIAAFVSRSRRVLVVDGDAARRSRLEELLAGDGIELSTAASLDEARGRFDGQRWDSIVLGPVLPGDDPASVAAELAERTGPGGLIVYAERHSDGRGHDGSPATRFRQIPNVAVVHTAESLLDRVVGTLHVPVERLPEPQRQMVADAHRRRTRLAGRKVLIVDDDIRNIFALTSVLEREEMQVLSAETGRDAIQVLERTPDVDAVLMDIMMPEMDGLDTTRAIRELPQFRNVPIIAVTANAMKGDREKCLEAGAWDYLAKPVDPDQMLSVLRAWLNR